MPTSPNPPKRGEGQAERRGNVVITEEREGTEGRAKNGGKIDATDQQARQLVHTLCVWLARP